MRPLLLALFAAGAAAQPLELPALVGFDKATGGIGPSETTLTFIAPADADSVRLALMQASWEANDRPATATFDAANPADLTLQGRRDDAACARFNAGPSLCEWNDNPAVSIRYRERVTGGFGGRFPIVRAAFALPGRVSAGQPITVTLRWNGTEGLRSGYRVLDVQVIGPAGQTDVPTAPLADPQPYSTSADTIALGRREWYRRGVNRDFGPGGEYRVIAGSCNDCHASAGRDMRRWHFESPVAAARAVFHGRPYAVGRAIASYLATVELPTPTDSMARPWNPPFQPGPGVDEGTVGRWIAGAGWEAVLEADHLMGPHLYPTGYHPDSIRALYGGTMGNERRYGINRRVIPVAVMLPLITQWWGRVSLPDMTRDWPAYCQGEFTFCYETSDLGQRDADGPVSPAWGRVPAAFGSATQRDAAIERQRRWFQGTSGGVTHEYFLRQNGMQLPARRPEFDGVGFWPQLASVSLHRTLASRLLDVLTNLSHTSWGDTAWEVADDLTCDVPNTPGYPYTWPNGTMLLGATPPGSAPPGSRVSCAEAYGITAAQADWTLFAASTHIAARDGTGGPYDYPSQIVPAVGVANRNGYEAHIWYVVAAITETPVRITAPGSLSDWNYVHGHDFGAWRPGSMSSFMAQADGLTMHHLMQGPLPRPGIVGNWKGWYPHHAFHQRWLYEPSHWAHTSSAIGAQAAADIQAGLAEAWLDWSERYPAAAWDTVRGPNYADLDPRSATFEVPGDPHPGEWMTPGNYLMHWVALLDRIGARESTVDRLARFAASLFDTPSGFAAYFCEQPCGEPEPPPPPPPPPPPTNEAPSAFIVQPAEGARNVRLDPMLVTVDATDRDGQVVAVRLYCDLDGDGDRELCATATAPAADGRTWLLSARPVPARARQVSFHVEVEDDDGAITRPPDRTVRGENKVDR